MERQRRVATYRKVADELLKQALGIKEHAGAGRPSRQTLRFREVRDMSMQMLRNMAPKWLASACESLSEPIPGEGRNILKKGWDQIYLEPISAPGMYQCFPRAVSKSLQENS